MIACTYPPEFFEKLVLYLIIKIKLRSFKSSDHIKEKGDG